MKKTRSRKSRDTVPLRCIVVSSPGNQSKTLYTDFSATGQLKMLKTLAHKNIHISRAYSRRLKFSTYCKYVCGGMTEK